MRLYNNKKRVLGKKRVHWDDIFKLETDQSVDPCLVGGPDRLWGGFVGLAAGYRTPLGLPPGGTPAAALPSGRHRP